MSNIWNISISEGSWVFQGERTSMKDLLLLKWQIFAILEDSGKRANGRGNTGMILNEKISTTEIRNLN